MSWTSLRLSRDGVIVAIPMERLVSDRGYLRATGRRADPGTHPQTYSVLGATGQNVQITFNAEQITLAEAIVKAEELQDLHSDPAGVFLFRFEPPAVVTALNAPNWAQGPTEVRPSSIASI